VLLFARLGHSALWDDECYAALTAVGVWRTGDTSAVLDHNILANKGGIKLKNLKDRWFPPGMYYVAAPSIGLLGQTAFAARLPFAILGFATICAIAWWLWGSGADLRTWLVMTLAILGNVSLLLHLRQCRYYAICILLSVLLVKLYTQWRGSRRTLIVMSVLALMLMATNYMAYAALMACAAGDYLVWQRKRHRLRAWDWLILVGMQVLIGAAIVSTWNPTGKSFSTYERTSWMGEHLRLIWWNLRDLNTCEFGVGVLMALGPIVYLFKRDVWLLRASLGILLYCVVVGVLSPQPAPPTGHLSDDYTELRYLAPLIPLCIFLGARVILALTDLTRRIAWLAIPLAALAFGSNVLHGGPYAGGSQYAAGEVLPPKTFDSTIVRFVGELISPPPSSYRATADWINQNVQPQQSIWVLPEYSAYPLMYHAPKALYAWQLAYPPEEEQFRSLPEIHFKGRLAPDFIIAGGYNAADAKRQLDAWARRNGPRYRVVHIVPLYWYDLTRPEIFWHAFSKVEIDPKRHGVFILQHVGGSPRR
jgi:hypothetical protein